MEDSRELTPIERANQAREREGVRVLGWMALGISLFCWSVVNFFLLLTCYVLAITAGRAKSEFVVWLAPAIGCGLAMLGFGLAIRSRAVFGAPIRHSQIAAVLNALFLIWILPIFVLFWL